MKLVTHSLLSTYEVIGSGLDKSSMRGPLNEHLGSVAILAEAEGFTAASGDEYLGALDHRL
jgi:hypothetical protein